jgi:hypothetical protein
MIDSDEVLVFGGIFGVLIFLIGIGFGNSVLFRMQSSLNREVERDERVSPWKVMGKGGGKYRTYSKYEALFGNDSLVCQDRYSARMIWFGALMGFGCLLIEKVRH